MDGNGIQRDIGRLEGKIDSLVRVVGDARGEMSSLRHDFMDMEKGRLSSLEVKVATNETKIKIYIGVAAAVASLVAGLVVRFML